MNKSNKKAIVKPNKLMKGGRVKKCQTGALTPTQQKTIDDANRILGEETGGVSTFTPSTTSKMPSVGAITGAAAGVASLGTQLVGDVMQTKAYNDSLKTGDVNQDVENTNVGASAGLGALKAAGAGASIGAIAGPLGSAIGAGAGALIGGVSGLISGNSRRKAEAEEQKQRIKEREVNSNISFGNQVAAQNARKGAVVKKAAKGRVLRPKTSDLIEVQRGEVMWTPGTGDIQTASQLAASKGIPERTHKQKGWDPQQDKVVSGIQIPKPEDLSIVFGENENPLTGHKFQKDAQKLAHKYKRYSKMASDPTMSQITRRSSAMTAMHTQEAFGELSELQESLRRPTDKKKFRRGGIPILAKGDIIPDSVSLGNMFAIYSVEGADGQPVSKTISRTDFDKQYPNYNKTLVRKTNGSYTQFHTNPLLANKPSQEQPGIAVDADTKTEEVAAKQYADYNRKPYRRSVADTYYSKLSKNPKVRININNQKNWSTNTYGDPYLADFDGPDGNKAYYELLNKSFEEEAADASSSKSTVRSGRTAVPAKIVPKQAKVSTSATTGKTLEERVVDSGKVSSNKGGDDKNKDTNDKSKDGKDKVFLPEYKKSGWSTALDAALAAGPGLANIGAYLSNKPTQYNASNYVNNMLPGTMRSLRGQKYDPTSELEANREAAVVNAANLQATSGQNSGFYAANLGAIQRTRSKADADVWNRKRMYDYGIEQEIAKMRNTEGERMAGVRFNVDQVNEQIKTARNSLLTTGVSQVFTGIGDTLSRLEKERNDYNVRKAAIDSGFFKFKKGGLTNRKKK